MKEAKLKNLTSMPADLAQQAFETARKAKDRVFIVKEGNRDFKFLPGTTAWTKAGAPKPFAVARPGGVVS